MSIFREYDIRGVVGKDLTVPVATKIGLAFGARLKDDGRRVISMGRDARPSGPVLFEALARGLSASGVTIVDIGVCPTPLLYFSLFQFPVEGGIMITGSHNPAEYNGFKLCIGRDIIYGEDLQLLRKAVESGPLPTPVEPPVASQHREIIPLYHDYIVKAFSGLSGRGIRVVLDSGNGTAGVVAPSIFRALGCDVVELYSEPDGRFPNHHPDPTMPENLKDLILAVRKERAAFGVGYDGDADRIGVVDEKGEILWGDQLMMIFARDIIDHWKKKAVGLSTPQPPVFISEVKASQILFDDIEKKGGRAVMWKAGHSLIKAKMKEERAVLAGELSGHLFFGDRYFGFDDAIYASVRLLELVVQKRRPVSELLSDIPRSYNTPEIRVECSDEKKFELVEQVKTALENLHRSNLDPAFKIKNLITVDGVRAVFEGGWGLVRASNTQPALVLRFEAGNLERLNQIKAFIEKVLDSQMQH